MPAFRSGWKPAESTPFELRRMQLPAILEGDTPVDPMSSPEPLSSTTSWLKT
ncbi:MAG TPA: hypothetical protein VIU37_02995 [Candidatus Limnocylindrales bacterium]